MPDVTNEELARRLVDLRTDLHEDLADIKARLGALVPREVYDAQREALVRRVETVERLQTEADTHRRSLQRWILGSIVVPVGLIIIQLYLTAKGVGP